MPCKCPQCTDTPDETYTEKHRHGCEVNFVAAQSGEWINAHLEGVKLKRGFEAYKKLRDEVVKIWESR